MKTTNNTATETLDPSHIKITEHLIDESLGHEVWVEALPRRVAGGYVVDVRKAVPPCISYSAVVANLRRP